MTQLTEKFTKNILLRAKCLFHFVKIFLRAARNLTVAIYCGRLVAHTRWAIDMVSMKIIAFPLSPIVIGRAAAAVTVQPKIATLNAMHACNGYS